MFARIRPPSAFHLWIGGTILLWLLYASVFLITGSSRGADALVVAFANVLPLVLLAVATHQLLRTQIVTKPVPVQILTHFLLAPVFALTWYALLIVLLGFISGARGYSFAPIGFSGPAVTWQIFQGLILYALVTAVCYAIRGGREAAQVTLVQNVASQLHRYLVRDSDGFRPIEVSRIVTITGAQDYSEVTTLDGIHLVRMSLGDFERLLDPTQFVRVHRSAIISLQRLELAESAGQGRMVARMTGGQTVPVSRAGAASLREHVA